MQRLCDCLQCLTSHLHHRPNMKSFNARRRFRCAIHAVQLVRFLGHNKSANEDSDHRLGDGGGKNHHHGQEHENVHSSGNLGETIIQNNSTASPEGLYQSTILTKVVQTSAGKLPVEV